MSINFIGRSYVHQSLISFVCNWLSCISNYSNASEYFSQLLFWWRYQGWKRTFSSLSPSTETTNELHCHAFWCLHFLWVCYTSDCILMRFFPLQSQICWIYHDMLFFLQPNVSKKKKHHNPLCYFCCLSHISRHPLPAFHTKKYKVRTLWQWSLWKVEGYGGGVKGSFTGGWGSYFWQPVYWLPWHSYKYVTIKHCLFKRALHTHKVPLNELDEIHRICTGKKRNWIWNTPREEVAGI